MSQVMAVILAGGYGKRMNSRKPDVLHEVCGKPMLDWVLASLKEAGIEKMTVLTDGGNEAFCSMKQHICCVGPEKYYNANTINNTNSVFNDINGDTYTDIVVVPGNMPLIRGITIKELLMTHLADSNDYTAGICDTAAYSSEICSVSGIYRSVSQIPFCCSFGFFGRLIENTGISSELPDLSSILRRLDNEQFKQGSCLINDPVEIIAIEDRMQLALVNGIMRQKILDRHMLAGVTIIDTMSTYIDGDVKIGRDTVLYPGTILEKGTDIGEACTIGPNSRIRGCFISDGVEVASSVVLDSRIGAGTHVGPFAYIRPDSEIGKDVKIGDFVEVKKSVIGNGSKVSHLTYVGDAEVGRNVNLGCGVVFVNYNGRDKNRTIVKDNAFVGCNANLVSPVTIKENAYIAAGSTITEEVPENALAIARSRQVNKEDWVNKKGLYKKKD